MKYINNEDTLRARAFATVCHVEAGIRRSLIGVRLCTYDGGQKRYFYAAYVTSERR